MLKILQNGSNFPGQLSAMRRVVLTQANCALVSTHRMDKSNLDVPLCNQEGIFRVNCMDCLDRTNVVQSMFARSVLLSLVSVELWCIVCVGLVFKLSYVLQTIHVVYIYMEQCPAKSPLWYFIKYSRDKQKKSNAHIEMYG